MFFVVDMNIFSGVFGNVGGIIANIIGAGQFDPLPPCSAIMTKARVQ